MWKTDGSPGRGRNHPMIFIKTYENLEALPITPGATAVSLPSCQGIRKKTTREKKSEGRQRDGRKKNMRFQVFGLRCSRGVKIWKSPAIGKKKRKRQNFV
ncbi:hypothetical protein RUM44_000111 [Polyplax serrata]|uniref:Uncharacterized protein n=1 Tax=Polyplax serrata TaxID=468196 RepID=A0ABR1B4K4_POLSC